MKILKVIVKGYNKVGLVLRIMIGISGDVAFAATAEYYHWRKQGKPLPDFLQKRKNRKEKGGE